MGTLTAMTGTAVNPVEHGRCGDVRHDPLRVVRAGVG